MAGTPKNEKFDPNVSMTNYVSDHDDIQLSLLKT